MGSSLQRSLREPPRMPRCIPVHDIRCILVFKALTFHNMAPASMDVGRLKVVIPSPHGSLNPMSDPPVARCVSHTQKYGFVLISSPLQRLTAPGVPFNLVVVVGDMPGYVRLMVSDWLGGPTGRTWGSARSMGAGCHDPTGLCACCKR